MRFGTNWLALVPALMVGLTAAHTNALEFDPLWNAICHTPGVSDVVLAAASQAALPPVAKCGPEPTTFQELPSVGGNGDTAVTLNVGYDAQTQRLCFVNSTLNEAPVIHVGAGHTLTFQLGNTLHNTGGSHLLNCPIQVFGGTDGYCVPRPYFLEQPGADGPYYPLEANQAHTADGTTNLHVHGLFVSPQPCSDEVLRSTVYPANWIAPVGLQPCQTSPTELTYTYNLPPMHPSGLYWYHTHRHGTAEQESQMGLIGAIVVEDTGDAQRRALGVTDEVLVVSDTPKLGCLIGNQCDGPNQPAAVPLQSARQPNQAAARAAARLAAANATQAAANGGVVLDPRIDEADQAGGCAQGASDADASAGGTQLWTLKLNGANVAENGDGSFPPDSEVLSKTMQPNQRQLFRVANASADTFIAPQLVLVQNGVATVQQLEVFARDGVGLADASGNRHFGYFDVASNPLVVPPAGRIEFVVHAPPVGATLYLDSAQVFPGCGGNQYPARRLLRITSAGTPVQAGPPGDTDLLTDPVRLRDYLLPLNAAPTVHRTLVFAEYSRGFTYGVTKWLSGPPSVAQYDASQVDFYITQVASDDGEVHPKLTAMVPFNPHNLAPQVVVHLHGKESVTEEWLVENATLEIHAFHIHQIHFRDISADSTDPDLQPVLDTDVLPAAQLVGNVATGYPGAPGWIRLRMTFTKADIGEFVFHCHILEHEDNGMMSKIQVVAD